MASPVLEKYGKYVFLTPARLEQSEAMFERFSWVTLLISRYIAVVRDILPYITGIQRMRLRTYVPLMLAGSLLWSATFIYLGGLLDHLFKLLEADWKQELVPAIVMVIALAAGYWVLHRKLRSLARSPRQKGTGLQSNEASDCMHQG